MSEIQVFISYAWGGESEEVANELESVLSENGIPLIRDKSSLGFKGVIGEFMRSIGKGGAVVLVISDKSLRSKNCMFELLEIRKHGDFVNRIFPVILPDAQLYEPIGIIGYMRYWEQKIKELEKAARELDSIADAQNIYNEINLYTDIRGTFDELAGILADMNVLTLEIMRARKYRPLLDLLLVLTKPEAVPSRPGSTKPAAPKEGKVLYHIPSMMQVDSWNRCTVRVAWEELLLLQDLRVSEEDRVIESIRLGEVMQVALLESPAEGNFQINTLTNQEQIVTDDDYTQWLFDVKPLKKGQFRLLLRVTIIQVVQGKERSKDIVLERVVTTEAAVPQALPHFEVAGEPLGVLNEEEFQPHSKSVFLPPSEPPRTEKPEEPVKQLPARNSFLRYLPYAASAIVVMLGLTMVYRSMAPAYKVVNNSDDYVAGSESPVVSPDPEEMDREQAYVVVVESRVNPDMKTYALLKPDLIDSLRGDSLKVTVIPKSDTVGMNLAKMKHINNLRELSDSVDKWRAARPAPFRSPR